MRARPTFSRSMAGLFAVGIALSNPATAALTPCAFSFGAGWNGLNVNYPASMDFVTIWAGGDENWNAYWIGDMLKACKPGGKLAGKTPVYYSYIIAFTARRDLGLQDCNVGSPNLCQKGANFIRQKKDRILAQYAKYASETAKAWGTTEPIVWMMEPDYYQYAGETKQEGGPLSYPEAGNMMKDIVAKVRESLPNAVFSLDISPWIPDAAKWYAAFKMDDFTYINTSGGETDANNSRIRAGNAMTWKSIHDVTNKPIIADDGYGVAGSSTYHDATWDNVSNLNARIADGVVAISQTNPKSDWNSTLTSVRPQLNAEPCPVGLRPHAPLPPRGLTAILWDALGRPLSLKRMAIRK
ncbi:MAG: hypothetical protein ABIW76_06275 [Fibrobacteria bacterium]